MRAGYALLVLCGALSLAAPVVAQERPVDKARQRAEHQQGMEDDDTIHKIVGGKAATPGKFPFQVALIWSGTAVDREFYGQFCGGTLIANDWVLTAAHCVPNTTAEEVDVYVGAQILPMQAPATGNRVHLARVLSHQAYNAATKDNDIALLKLANPPTGLKPATLVTADLAKQIGVVGTDLTVIGWGATSQGGGTTSALREVDVTVRDSAVCQQNYRSVVPGTVISAGMFCAGQPQGGKDSCQGDSGGFIGAPFQNRWVAMGVVSWGVGCAQPRLFGVYTRVSEYVAWVTNTINAN